MSGLAELEIYHSRPFAPTRRLSLGASNLPVDPAPGPGGILLGAVVPRPRWPRHAAWLCVLGIALPLARGWRWMTNDRVNLACTLVGAAVPFLWFWVMG